jgi:transcription initiation factor TFIID subunit 2
MLAPAPAAPPPPAEPEFVLGFQVLNQKLNVEVDFGNQSLFGETEITVVPLHRDLREIRINARQCEILNQGVQIDGRPAPYRFEDPYRKVDVPDNIKWSAEQHELQKERIRPLLNTKPAPGELSIRIPNWLRIEEVNPFSESAASILKDRALAGSAVRLSSVVGSGTTAPLLTPATATPRDADGVFQPFTVKISFRTRRLRNGLHWVGLQDGEAAYPHVYSRHTVYPGTASCIFPCIDDPNMRCTWDISVKCGRTLGDALRKPQKPSNTDRAHGTRNVHGDTRPNGVSGVRSSSPEYVVDLNDEDALLEMVVVGSGDLVDEFSDPNDRTKKIARFQLENQVAAQHIGLAVGPFEEVDLSEFREEEEDEKLGQKAIQVKGYCLPGRTNEVRHTCTPMAHAIDWLSLTFTSYPFHDFKLCFIEDFASDAVAIASLAFCSTRLLFTEQIIDTEEEVTRQLVLALASQWAGINLVPAARADIWVVVGIAHFITDLFMKQLCGNNDYRFLMKTLSDKLVDLDIQRPSLYALGETLHLGAFEMEFMALKAPLVLFILDRRLAKSSGSTGLTRIITKILYTANTGVQMSDKTVTTEGFRRACEKIGHYKLDAFFNQWVMGAGCPRFQVTQRFNKKRLAVEMTILQKQDTPTSSQLKKEDFVRELKEEVHGVYAAEPQPFFTGPMTIRIHEADGTPYEHVVEIREAVQRFEIPYHTKYKRLKRSRREKERATAGPGVDIIADNENDVLLYCLGDVLQSESEMADWGLVDWSAELEAKMQQESYEWIRMDADFEWLCELTINMPAYMFVSQLQQDRDVVAQQDSMLYLGKQPSHTMVSTILVRTLMDRRYFHGVRELAASYLPMHATEKHEWLGRRHLERAFQEFYCYPGTLMPRPNNFEDKTAYLLQCAIVKAMARVRDLDGVCPAASRSFLLDQLRFNDNGDNEYSDFFYVANLMNALADSAIPLKKDDGELSFAFNPEDAEELRRFQQKAVDEIDRYRRMDEWIDSYQNIYATTALGCAQRLMKASVMPRNLKKFLIYARDGNSDVVRIKAFEGATDIGFFQQDSFMKYLLCVLSTDPSPFVRDRLFQVLCEGLAGAAFGEYVEEEPAPAPDDMLIVDDEADMQKKQAKIKRTGTIDGALAALKTDLQNNEALKEWIWRAICSREIGVMEQSDLLDVCSVLYEAVESMVLVLPYPRYWRAINKGKVRCPSHSQLVHLLTELQGRIAFVRTNKVRTKQLSRPPPPKPPPIVLKAPEQPRPPPLVLQPIRETTANLPTLTPNPNKLLKRPTPLPERREPSPAGSPRPERPTRIVKLPLPSWRLQKFPPGPYRGSRALLAKPALQVQKPATPSSGLVKLRVPLPTTATRTPLPDTMAPPSVGAPPAKKPGGFTLKLKLGKQNNA